MKERYISFLKKRQLLFRWANWFFLANIVILMFIGLNYVRMMPSFHAIVTASTGGRVFAYIFLILAFITQFTISAFAAYCIALFALAFFPRRQVVLPLSVILGTALALFFVSDSIVYHLYHLHLAGVVWHILMLGVANDVLALSWLEWLIMSGLACGFLLVETLLAFFIWKKVKSKGLRGCSYIIPAILSIIILASYTTMLTALSSRTRNPVYLSNIHLIEIGAQFVPYYNDVLGLILPMTHGQLFLQLMGGGFFYQPPQIVKPLKYPLKPMQCKPRKKLYNIVIIFLDAWRFDMLNAQTSPNIYRFSQQADTFSPHFSGGNCTGPGVFSLFYSIPYTYWTSVLQEKKSPVLINELLNHNYQMGIFVSASLHYPAFDKTIFQKVKNLRIENPGKYSYENDQFITKEFKTFLKNRNNKKPFFSFIFYDTSHNYCEKPDGYAHPFQPAWRVCNRIGLNSDSDRTPLFNVYRNAIHFDDQLAGQVLNELKKENLLKNTIVIISADHGEQFNENRKGIWGHASDYTRWQLQVPLIVYQPGKKIQKFNYFTSHYDIVPFLMREVFGCSNNVHDYSIGKPLFLSPKNKNINLFAASYIDYALVQNNRITRIYPNGNVRIYDNNDDDIKGASLDVKTAKTFFNITNEYYKASDANK